MNPQGIDLSASITADLLRLCQGDHEKANEYVAGIEEEKKKEQQRKIDELAANFGDIDREVLRRILAENDWDFDKAIVPCFTFQEEQKAASRQKEQEEQRKKREQERQARNAEARKQGAALLMQLFSNQPEEKLKALLEENEGDVDLTIEQILAQNKAEEEKEIEKKRFEEEENRKRNAQLEKQLSVDTLVQR